MHFDARAAKLLNPGEHLLVSGCPGLRLEVSVSRKTWTYRYKSVNGGRLKQVAIGHWPATSVQTAAAKWQELRDQRDAGTDPGQQRKIARKASLQEQESAYTVSELVQDFTKGHLRIYRRAAGALAAQRALDDALAGSPEFANQPAAEVSRQMAFGIIDSRKDKPMAAAKLRSLLGAAWDYALDSGKLDEDVPNRWRQVMKGRLNSKGKVVGGKHVGQQRRVLQPAEIAALLRWLPNMHTLGADTFQMYLWTCARGVEILGMRPENVKEEADGWWWTVPKAQTKNARFAAGMDLRVPLVGRALEIVTRRLASVGKSGWLFEDARGEQYEQKDFSTYIYSLMPYSEKVKRRESEGLVIKVTHWTPHNLRRTSRTLLASLGCQEEIAEAIIGHLPKNIVGTYNAYSYDAERKQWLGALSNHIETLAAALPALP